MGSFSNKVDLRPTRLRTAQTHVGRNQSEISRHAKGEQFEGGAFHSLVRGIEFIKNFPRSLVQPHLKIGRNHTEFQAAYQFDLKVLALWRELNRTTLATLAPRSLNNVPNEPTLNQRTRHLSRNLLFIKLNPMLSEEFKQFPYRDGRAIPKLTHSKDRDHRLLGRRQRAPQDHVTILNTYEFIKASGIHYPSAGSVKFDHARRFEPLPHFSVVGSPSRCLIPTGAQFIQNCAVSGDSVSTAHGLR